MHGSLIGVGSGVAAGLIEGDDPENYFFSFSAGDKALAYGILLGVTGALLGLLLGAVVRKKFTISGSKEKFDQMRYNLLR